MQETFPSATQAATRGAHRAVCGLLLLGTLTALAIGCREEVPPLFRRNRAPETSLVIAAEESTIALYEYHVYWKGEDADGEVVRYLFAITDTLSEDEEENWDPSLAQDRERGVFTTRTDSIFFFDSALGTQAFNVVAIDDFGEMDPSPARQFFKVIDRGTPVIRFQEVRTEAEDQVPCVSTEPCTVPMYANFNMRFVASTRNGKITGITWSANNGLWEPFGALQDTFFLPSGGFEEGVDEFGKLQWRRSATGDTITAFYENPRQPASSSLEGTFQLQVNARDQARLQVLPKDGSRRVTVNYDPRTQLQATAACNCPQPPPGCSMADSVSVGWITGIGQVNFPRDQWQPFCPGDTVPNLSKVNFLATGSDDPRDGALDPSGVLANPSYRFRFEYTGDGVANSSAMSFSLPSLPHASLTTPGGGTWNGAERGWATCPFNYLFQASAQDEQGRVDGTPASMRFFVGGSPTLDSLAIGTYRAGDGRAPKVMVFVPNCGQIFSFFCPQQSQVRFGADTVAVFAEHLTAAPGETPYDLGRNRFVFPFKAWGHDHPRDKNPPGGPTYYLGADEGQIRAWRYTFDCTTPLCEDQALLGEGGWRREERQGLDPPRQEVFDEGLSVTIFMDTLCTSSTRPCPFPSIRGRLRFNRFGHYFFTIQGRDTPPTGAACRVPSGLGDNPNEFVIDISNEGRTTQVLSTEVTWVQYWDVRPPPRSVAESPPFANLKRLME